MNRIFTAIGIAVLILSCAPEAIEESTGNLSGIVYDKSTGDPVPVVNIELEPSGKSTVTGSDGGFSFNNLKSGEYCISFSKEGYKAGNKNVSVTSGEDTETHLTIERIPAVITCDRELLDFGDNASMNTLSFNIVNNNHIDLNYSIIENCGWIVESDPTSGVLPYGKTGTIVLKIDRELLIAGVNETVVVVRTEGEGSSELTVRAIGIEKKKPALNIHETTEVKASSAMLNAEITDPGAPAYTERGFVYSESPMPDLDNTIAKMTASVTDDKTFSVKLEGLTLGTTYYARAYAVNEIGTAYSTNQVSFKTVATIPVVTLDGINVDASGKAAMLYGAISYSGDPAYHEKGFVYSTTDTYPTIYDNKLTVSGDNHGAFETKLTSLEYDVDYFVRAFATNEAGTAYSDMQKIIIESSLPVVITKDITDVDKEHSVAVLHGEITNAGLPVFAEKGFVYSDLYESPTIYDSKFVVEGSQSGRFEYRCTELPATRSYYVRAYAINDKGVVYGEVVNLFEKDWVEISSINIAVMKSDIGIGSWHDTNSLCENTSHEGYTDWRLPSLDELATIYTISDIIGGFSKSKYWSNLENSEYDGDRYYDDYYYWTIDFNSGTRNAFGRDGMDRFHARCIRTLK